MISQKMLFFFCSVAIISLAFFPGDASAQFLGTVEAGEGAQSAEPPQPAPPQTEAPAPVEPAPAAPPATFPASVPVDYELAPGDTLSIWVEHEEQISSRSYTVDSSGFIGIPIIGRVPAAGRTLDDLEEEITVRAGAFIKEPLVIVSLEQMRGVQITVLGSVAKPGVYSAVGVRTLLEVLSDAGGLLPEAGPVIRVSRLPAEGPIPHELAVEELGTGRSVVDLSLNDVTQLRGNSNVVLKPGDIITIEEADMVYLLVEGRAQGRVPLTGGDGIYLVEALVMAGGLSPSSEPDKATILRGEPADGRTQHIKVNVEKILEGKEPDVQLVANDILYIPASNGTGIADRVMQQGVSSIISGLTWGIFR